MHLPLKNNVYILHSHPGDDLENNSLAQVTFGKWANYHLFLSIQQSPLDVYFARVALEKQIHYKWEQSQFHVFCNPRWQRPITWAKAYAQVQLKPAVCLARPRHLLKSHILHTFQNVKLTQKIFKPHKSQPNHSQSQTNHPHSSKFIYQTHALTNPIQNKLVSL